MSKEQTRSKPGPPPRLTGGLILVLLGVLFLLAETERLSWADWWAYFLVGLGGILIFDFLIRAFSSADRRSITGKLIAGLVLMVIGGAHLLGLEEWWPLVLIAIGAAILISSFVKKN